MLMGQCMIATRVENVNNTQSKNDDISNTELEKDFLYVDFGFRLSLFILLLILE